MKATCPLCKQESRLFFRTKDYNRRLSNETFHYYRCRACKLIFLSPIPTNLGDYYPPDYYGIPTTLAPVVKNAESERFKIDIVKKFVASGAMLEIGPSYGAFAYLAKEAGFEVDVIEMDEECCNFLREIVGVHVVHSADVPAVLSTPDANGKYYDAIALWHVIEHLTNPWSTLDAAAAHLSPGGIVVVAAPNPSGIQFRILRRYWPHVDAPRHLFQIPIPLLIQYAKSIGLEAIFITTSDPGMFGYNKFGWKHFLSNCITHPQLRTIVHKIGGLVALLVSPIERSGWRGSTYTVVLRKAPQ